MIRRARPDAGRGKPARQAQTVPTIALKLEEQRSFRAQIDALHSDSTLARVFREGVRHPVDLVDSVGSGKILSGPLYLAERVPELVAEWG